MSVCGCGWGCARARTHTHTSKCERGQLKGEEPVLWDHQGTYLSGNISGLSGTGEEKHRNGYVLSKGNRWPTGCTSARLMMLSMTIIWWHRAIVLGCRVRKCAPELKVAEYSLLFLCPLPQRMFTLGKVRQCSCHYFSLPLALSSRTHFNTGKPGATRK